MFWSSARQGPKPQGSRLATRLGTKHETPAPGGGRTLLHETRQGDLVFQINLDTFAPAGKADSVPNLTGRLFEVMRFC